jgi:hypothetical protein
VPLVQPSHALFRQAMDAKLATGIAAGALVMHICGPVAGSGGRSQPQAATSATAELRDARSVRVAGLFPSGSPQAKKVEAAVLAAGATWLGTEETFESFSDETLASITVLAAQKINGENLGRNYSKLTSLEWFQTWSAGVEHIFRDNKCPVRCCPIDHCVMRSFTRRFEPAFDAHSRRLSPGQELPTSPITMTNASGAYTEIIAECAAHPRASTGT